MFAKRSAQVKTIQLRPQCNIFLTPLIIRAQVYTSGDADKLTGLFIVICESKINFKFQYTFYFVLICPKQIH